MHLSVNRLALPLMLLGAAMLQGCGTSPRQQGSNTSTAPASLDYCIGRVAVTAQEPLQFLASTTQFYWGDIDTWREDAASYRRRVLAAQASVDGARVRQLLKPVETLPHHDGVLIVAREEDQQPFDPNVVQVTGFIHRDGSTMRFQKRAVSRLQEVTEQRAREILAASDVSSKPYPPARQAQDGFCVMHGMVKLYPLPGWHEATRTEGKFMLQGTPYRFSLRTRYLRSLSLNALEADNQRVVLAELAGGTQGSPLTEQALQPNASLLTLRTSAGSKRIVEWRLPASSVSPSTPVTFLYVWPESDTSTARARRRFHTVAGIASAAKHAAVADTVRAHRRHAGQAGTGSRRKQGGVPRAAHLPGQAGCGQSPLLHLARRPAGRRRPQRRSRFYPGAQCRLRRDMGHQSHEQIISADRQGPLRCR